MCVGASYILGYITGFFGFSEGDCFYFIGGEEEGLTVVPYWRFSNAYSLSVFKSSASLFINSLKELGF